MDEATMPGSGLVSPNNLAAKGKKEGAIGQSAQQLQKAVAILQDEFYQLVDTLQPALTPEPPTDTAQDGQPIAPQSDLANFISRETEKVAQLAMKVRSTRQRVEL